MKVIFLTMSRLSGIAQRHIYADLLRKFRDEGHVVYIALMITITLTITEMYKGEVWFADRQANFYLWWQFR